MIGQAINEAWFRGTERALIGQGDENPCRVLRTAFAGVDYRAERPFLSWSREQIVNVAEQALAREWPALELATLLFDESRNRKPRVQWAVEKAFKRHGAQPVSWLEEAQKICAEIPVESPALCNGAVYVVLLRPAGNSAYAAYVGSTRTTNYRGFPDRQSARVAQHFQGGRDAARAVHNRGLEPLWSLNHFFYKVVGSREYLPHLETRVHRALERCGIKVHGDTVD